MVKVVYSVYSFYTDDNDIYIGISKNVEVRIHQHKYKSSNYRLRGLIDDPQTEVFSEILYEDLTYEEACKMERSLIKRYRADPQYRILNVNSGGMRKHAEIFETQKLARISRQLNDDEVISIREKFSKLGRKIDKREDSKPYNLAPDYFMKLLRGKARGHLGGPILGKDYNGKV